jgi:predicted O-linked N-acetylglucosamine transferase (SPINDLY family)
LAIKFLKANADAVLVLIDHSYPAFKLRIEERFKEQGLQGKIMFMPYQQLYNGDLHKFLALIDVNLDTVVYNGHTASHDVLWANGVLISVRGKSLASRVGADLLHHFGTPENICYDPAAAVARVNQLLQNPTCLSEARVKADQCRATSKMYDNSHRAEIVIEALLRAFDDKLAASRQRNQLACSASASQQLLDSDMESLCCMMDGLGIAVTGNHERSNRFLC